MKVLTLHQPWASLIAIGLKTIETRPSLTHLRGRIAVHAAARRPDFAVMKSLIAENPSVWNAWFAAGLVSADGSLDCIPLGAIVATINLADSVPIVQSVVGLQRVTKQISTSRPLQRCNFLNRTSRTAAGAP